MTIHRETNGGSTLTINKESIGLFRTLMCEPEKHGLNFPALKDCFEETTETRANHLLYQDYLVIIDNRPLPKFFFYLIMTETFGHPVTTDAKGNLGYKLRIVSTENKEK